MRKLLAGVLVSVLFSTSAQAGDFDYNTFCMKMSEIAESTMTLRQYNKPIAEMIKEDNEYAESDWLKDTLMVYTKEAYARPLRLSDEVKKIEINEFATKKYFDCLEVYE